MAKKFVPGSVGVHDAPGIYLQAWKFYQYLLDAEREAEGVVKRAHEQLHRAEKVKPEFVPEAEAILAQAKALAPKIRSIRVQTMAVYVTTIGDVLKEVQDAKLKGKGVLEEYGLGQFELDLDRAQQRYDEVYAPFFKKPLVVGKWGAEDWDRFNNEIAGPVLLWENIAVCKDRWVVEGVPPCHGPDYRIVWTLANQSGIISESMIHALHAYLDSVEDFFETATETIVKIISDVAAGIVLIAAAAAKGVAKGLFRGATIPLLLGVAAVTVLVVTSKKKRWRTAPDEKKA